MVCGNPVLVTDDGVHHVDVDGDMLTNREAECPEAILDWED